MRTRKSNQTFNDTKDSGLSCGSGSTRKRSFASCQDDQSVTFLQRNTKNPKMCLTDESVKGQVRSTEIPGAKEKSVTLSLSTNLSCNSSAAVNSSLMVSPPSLNRQGPIKLQACSVRLQRINDGIFTGRDVSVDKNQNVIKSKETLASQNISRSVRFAVSDPPQTNLDSINLSPILSQKNNRISSVSTPKYTPRSTKESPIDEDLFQILKNDSIEYFEKQLNTVKTEKKKRVAGKKTAKKSTRKFLPKSEIVFQFQRFLEFPVDKEVIPELMETCEKFNDLSLRRLKTMLTERKCTTPTLAHVKELMIETNLISDMGKLTNWSLYKNIVQVADFEVQNLLIPESGYSDLPKNLWDFEDQQ